MAREAEEEPGRGEDVQRKKKHQQVKCSERSRKMQTTSIHWIY